MHVTCMANYSALWRVVRGSGDSNTTAAGARAPEAWLLHLGTLPRSAECWDCRAQADLTSFGELCWDELLNRNLVKIACADVSFPDLHQGYLSDIFEATSHLIDAQRLQYRHPSHPVTHYKRLKSKHAKHDNRMKPWS
jgi:hypothetical protein